MSNKSSVEEGRETPRDPKPEERNAIPKTDLGSSILLPNTEDSIKREKKESTKFAIQIKESPCRRQNKRERIKGPHWISQTMLTEKSDKKRRKGYHCWEFSAKIFDEETE